MIKLSSFIHKYVNKKFTPIPLKESTIIIRDLVSQLFYHQANFLKANCIFWTSNLLFFCLKPVNEIIKNYDSWQTLECLPVNLKRLINYVPILTIFLSN